jgi:hypothetical protein
MAWDSNIGLVDEYWMGSNVRPSERLLPFSLHNILKYGCIDQFGNLCLLLEPKSDTAGLQEVFSRLLWDRAQRNDTGPVFNVVSLLVERVQIHLTCHQIGCSKFALQIKKKRLSQLNYSLFLKLHRLKTHKNVYVTKPDIFSFSFSQLYRAFWCYPIFYQFTNAQLICFKMLKFTLNCTINAPTCFNLTRLKRVGAFIVHFNVNFNILKQSNCALVGLMKEWTLFIPMCYLIHKV